MGEAFREQRSRPRALAWCIEHPFDAMDRREQYPGLPEEPDERTDVTP
jgi:hypothetical protein